MAIKSIYERDKQDRFDILALEDERAKEVIRIDADGCVHISDELKPDEAAVRFWESVLDFMPINHAENLKNKLMLIRAFNLVKKLKGDEKMAQSPEIEDEFEEIQEHFMRV